MCFCHISSETQSFTKRNSDHQALYDNLRFSLSIRAFDAVYVLVTSWAN